MAESSKKQRLAQMAVVAGIPLCLLTVLLFRNPSNDVFGADMPGGSRRHANRSRERVGMGLPMHRSQHGVQQSYFRTVA